MKNAVKIFQRNNSNHKILTIISIAVVRHSAMNKEEMETLLFFDYVWSVVNCPFDLLVNLLE
jgi:hypothetical protein